MTAGCQILAFDHSSELGGAEIGLLNLADELRGRMAVALLHEGPFAAMLRNRHLEPHVLDAGSTAESLVRRTTPVIGAASALWHQAARIRPRLLAALEETGAELLLCNTLRSAVLVALCRLPRRIRTIVMVRDGLRPPYLTRSRSVASKAIVALVGSHAVANSSWTASALWPLRPVHVMPPAIGREFFDDTLPAPTGDVRRVLLLGRIARWKGQLFGLEAARAVATPHPWTLTVAGGAWFGEEDYFREVRAFAAGMVAPRIDVVGHVTDVKGLIDAHDIVVHTSTVPEPFGQVVVQAMARGRVIIAAGEGGPADVISDGVNGLLYTPRDVQALAAVLGRALSDADAGHRIGEAGRVAALGYHPDRTVSRFLDIAAEATS